MNLFFLFLLDFWIYMLFVFWYARLVIHWYFTPGHISGIWFQIWDRVPSRSHIQRIRIWVWNSKVTVAGIYDFQILRYTSFYGVRRLLMPVSFFSFLWSVISHLSQFPDGSWFLQLEFSKDIISLHLQTRFHYELFITMSNCYLLIQGLHKSSPPCCSLSHRCNWSGKPWELTVHWFISREIRVGLGM